MTVSKVIQEGEVIQILPQEGAFFDGTEYFPCKRADDILVIGSSLVLGVSIFLTELFVRDAGATEYSAVRGIFGLVIVFAQAVILEQEMITIFWADGSFTIRARWELFQGRWLVITFCSCDA